MKWAKIVDDPESAKKKETRVDKACYRYISQSELQDHFGVWEHIKLSPEFKITPRGKKNYELFVGGYLSFYDEKVRSGTIDHALYFKWEKKDKHTPDNPKVAEVYESVTFFLHPRPRTKMHASLNIASEPQAGSNKTQEQHQEMFMAPPPGGFDDLSIDPPPPPPPPPPSMDDLDSE
ncbi:MAG TPA: hypothetical protein VGM41_16645 [Chitinophagaceae bacterium]|jgi:hypothetical protein